MRIIIISLISIFVFFSTNISVGAISQEQRRLFQSGVYYYNIDEINLCSGSAITQNNTGDVYILGDSITVRATPILNSSFDSSQSNITKINADVGRAISVDTFGEPRSPSGLEVVVNDSEIIKNSDTIVVALGTNSGAENYDQKIPELVSKIREVNPNISIVWVNTFFVTDISLKNNINESIQKYSESLNYSVIDMSLLNIPMEDGIHPTQEGLTFFVEQIVDGVSGKSTTTSSGTISASANLPPELDPRWIPVWTNAAAEFGTDPAYLGAIFTSEHGGNFSPYDGDRNGRWARPNGTDIADNTEAAAGPFQFLGSTWDDITGRMGESWPRSDRDDPVKSSRAAAKYLSMTGGVPGLEAGSFDQPQGFKPNRSEVPYTVASLAARYNQGLAWHDGRSIAGNNDVEWYANNAAEKFNLLKGNIGLSGISASDCNGEIVTSGENGWDLPGEGPNPLVYYSQLRSGNDPAVTGYYGNSAYGSGSISACGCGPTSFAMAVSTLTGNTVTPTEVAEWSSNNGGQQPGCGSYWWWVDQPEKTATKWGVKARQIGLDAAASELRKGNLIITSVGQGSVLLSPGGNGHLLLMRSVTNDGKFLFADPSDSEGKRNAYPEITELGSSRTPLDAATVSNGLKALFVLEAL